MSHQVVLDALELMGEDSARAEIAPLSGGVSCETYRVLVDSRSLVIKQALPKLRVAEDWESDPARIEAEAEALGWFHHLTPDFVPQPAAVFPELHVMVLPMAPSPSPDLRELILEGKLRNPEEIGAQLAELLVTWHRHDPTEAENGLLDDTSRLVSLRLEPFYRDLARRWPDHARVINEAGDELLSARLAVVHGDFTPKNVLVHPEGVWLIDPEVAHIGNPVLDTASMLSHALIKRLHLRDEFDRQEQMTQFIEAFDAGLGASEVSRPETLSQHIGVIMGVRAAGRSPVNYVDDVTRALVTHASRRLLEGAHWREVLT